MESFINLKIAETIIHLVSKFEIENLSPEEKRLQESERFNNFLYPGKAEPDIIIKINIVKELPKVSNSKYIFITTHPFSGRDNWQLLKKGRLYIYRCNLRDRQQLIFIDENFAKARAYLLPKNNKDWVWSFIDIIYDFLQVLLINYFGLKKQAIFVHAFGIKDIDGQGLLFAGKSGAGKSTSARLWHKHSKAMILNDDRIIVRKFKDRFFISGSPWHGDFSDYLYSRIESSLLSKLFFIHHTSSNRVRQLSQQDAFKYLFPVLFAAFWDRQCLENTISLCSDLLNSVPSYRLGFVNDKRIIDFVRRPKR